MRVAPRHPEHQSSLARQLRIDNHGNAAMTDSHPDCVAGFLPRLPRYKDQPIEQDLVKAAVSEADAICGAHKKGVDPWPL
jgi:hypothetical protein